MVQGPPVVLIVDDDESVRRALARLMRAAGLAVATFDSGAALLNHGCADTHGCIVLDVRMPDMDGLELQERLAAMGSALPVVMITAHESDDARRKAMQRGAVAFLHKPLDQESLLAVVRGALGIENIA